MNINSAIAHITSPAIKNILCRAGEPARDSSDTWGALHESAGPMPHLQNHVCEFIGARVFILCRTG